MQKGADWSRIKELFTATFEATPEERIRLLAAEDDPVVRQRVEVLLAAHDSVHGPLDRPAIAALDGIEPSRIAPVASLVGRRLGPYRILREIARGGMGAVYEGVREDQQFDQRVAIKTLLLGANSAAVLRRFRQERQILAGLQHPNIAALYDGAVTDDGLPYFVLEYVDGLPIDRHCADQHLDLRARLALFRQVVAAVQHAHRQLVIHRDLKPSNVLVTADGVVKLVDFGIAKVLQPDATDLTLEPNGPLTMSYASPEQVMGGTITTATDVYSSGVVLYRLLTGTTPLDLEGVSLDRAVTAICTETPPPPSQTAEQHTAEAMGLGSADRLRRLLRGELDAIVMMALRKEPERRYATVQALGDDLRRYLGGLPVTAAPDTTRYRLTKFAQRQRGLVTGIGIGVLAIVAGAGIALWQARSARQEAQRAAAVSRFLRSVIGAGDVSAGSPGARLGPSATVGQLLDSAARRLPSELGADPQARSEIHIALGRAYLTQERWQDANAQFRAARAVASRELGARRIEVARALGGLAEVAIMRGAPGADSLAGRALDVYDALGATRTAEYARILRLMAGAHALAGQFAQADTILARAMAIHDQLGTGPTIEKAMALADRAAVRVSIGRSWDATVADYQKALAMLEATPGADVVEKGYVLWYAAGAELGRGNASRADSLALESLRVFERAAGPTSMPVAQQLVQLAGIARTRGNVDAGRPYLERAMEIVRARPDMHPVVRERAQLEAARYRWAGHDLAAAESLARAAYQSRLMSANSLYIAEAGQVYGAVLGEQARYAAAESVLVDAYQRSVTATGRDAGFSRLTAASLVRLYYAWGRPGEAAPYLATLPDSTQRVLAAVRRARATDGIRGRLLPRTAVP